jgi:TatD DNase family protein
MYFDSHTHVNFSAFKDYNEEIIKRALDNNTWLMNVGTQSDTSKSAVDMAKDYEKGVYAAVGLHPVHTYQQMLDEEESHFQTRREVFDEKVYEKMLGPKVVAVGECGLDYYRIPQGEVLEEAKKLQRDAFVAQLHFAKKHNLPVTIHCRDAYEDLLEVLQAEYLGGAGVMHSFTDTWDTAQKFLEFGLNIAFNGILTFDKTGKLDEVVKNMPADRIMIETDAPYLTPPPHRGKRNEPSYVKYVAEKIANIRGEDQEKVGQQAFDNTCKLFKIKL